MGFSSTVKLVKNSFAWISPNWWGVGHTYGHKIEIKRT